MEVGDSVIAIGNAMGYGQSVTRGIVSALNRDVTTSEGITLSLIHILSAVFLKKSVSAKNTERVWPRVLRPVSYTHLDVNKRQAKGEFIAMLDHDDLLDPDALYETVRALNNDKSLDFIYSDSDLTDSDTMRFYNPLYKPDWSLHTMYSANYITHFSVIRTSIIKKAGGWNPAMDGAQDWDLFLRVSEITDKIYHIPQILYHWRVAESSTARDIGTKPYALDAQIRAIQSLSLIHI